MASPGRIAERARFEYCGFHCAGALSGRFIHRSPVQPVSIFEAAKDPSRTALTTIRALLVMVASVACLVPMVAIMRRPKAIPKDAAAMH
jgi:hypothetical protein